MGASQRRKGHNFEREIAAQLRCVFPNARRQLEYHEDDCKGVDIANTGRYKFQCKKTKRYVSVATIGEVICDEELGDVPILITAGDGERAMAVLPWKDFLTMLAKVEKAR